MGGGPAPIVDPEAEIAALAPLMGPEAVAAYCAAPPADRADRRNRIVTARMQALDVRFTRYVVTLARDIRAGRFGSDVLSLILTGTASVLQVPQTVQILTAADTALKGARASFDRELLVEQTLPILITVMQSNRTRIAGETYPALAKSDVEWPLALALSQVEAYALAGTLPGALLKAAEDAGARNRTEAAIFRTEVPKLGYGETPDTVLLNRRLDAAAGEAARIARLRRIQAIPDRLAPSLPEGVPRRAPFVIKSDDPALARVQSALVLEPGPGG